MFESIRRNKIKTGLIVSLFLIMIALILYFVCYYAFDLGPIAILIAFAFSVISTWATYYNSDKIVLKMNNARPATKEENLKLVNILDSLVVASGLKYTPKLYVIDDPQPNAFATGRNPQNAVICVTTGLLNKMEYYELEGVVAHELGHIRNYDIRLSAVVTVMVGLVVMLADFVTDILFWGGGRRDSDNKGNPVILIIGLVCLILAPIFGQLMQLAISRKREFMADATAIEFTRNPGGLISALQKLDSDPNQLRRANNATAQMYIVNPFKSNDKRKKKSSLWSTHPSIEDRIEALRNNYHP